MPDVQDTTDSTVGWRATWAEHRPTVLTLLVLLLIAFIFYGQWRRDSGEAMAAALEFTTAARAAASHQVAPDELEAQMLHILERNEAKRSGRELYLHLAIALVVAVVVIFLVELRAATRRKEEMREHRQAIAESVWKAVVRRMVPDMVVREIDNVLRARAVRKECRYTITFKPAYPNMPPDFLVLERKVVYTLANVTNVALDIPVRATISPVHATVRGRALTTGGDVAIARHLEFKVGGQGIPINQQVLDRSNPLALLHFVRLRGGAEVEVYLRSEEAVQTRDHYAVFMVAPSCGLTLRIDDSPLHGKIAIDDVQLNSTSRDESFQLGDDNVRNYRGALLPGQGFFMRWSPRKA